MGRGWSHCHSLKVAKQSFNHEQSVSPLSFYRNFFYTFSKALLTSKETLLLLSKETFSLSKAPLLLYKETLSLCVSTQTLLFYFLKTLLNSLEYLFSLSFISFLWQHKNDKVGQVTYWSSGADCGCFGRRLKISSPLPYKWILVKKQWFDLFQSRYYKSVTLKLVPTDRVVQNILYSPHFKPGK